MLWGAGNETTFAQYNASSCACKVGFMRDANATCQPCPPNHYCTPCTDDSCPAEGTHLIACFAQSEAPAGSTSVSMCQCTSGLVALIRHALPSLLLDAVGS